MTRKLNLWFLLAIPVCIYFGYVIGLIENERAGYEDFLYYSAHPFPIVVNETTRPWIFGGFLVGLVVFLVYYSHRPLNPRMPGKEYGASRFEDTAVVTKKLGTEPAKILGSNTRLSLDDRATGLNNNLLVIGGSGAGKTFRFIKPNILRLCGHLSMAVTDPKGEILRDVGKYLKHLGIRVKVLNLVDMNKSDHYNPLAYLRSQSDVVKLVNVLIKNTTPKGASQSDPFWEKSESLYLQSLIFYVWLSPKMKGRRNLKSVIDLMKEARVPENEKEKTALDQRMDELLKSDWSMKDPVSGKERTYPGKDHPAYVSYQQIRNGAVDTVRSIFISANARMGFLMNSPELLEILSRDDMGIPSLGMGCRGYRKQKTALFIVTPDADSTYNAVVGMLYSQLFQELYFQADNHTRDGRLPIPVSLWMDEFANVALPNDFTSILSTMRSRGISANIVVQNLAQLKERYEKSWETITGNCDTLIYLGGNEQSTHKYVSELLGKWTIGKQSSSNAHGRNGSSSTSEDIIGRELMTADEVRMMNNRRELVFIRGEYPVIDSKFDTLNDPAFRESQELGPYRYGDYHGLSSIAEQLPSVQPLSKDEAEYEAGQSEQPVITIDLNTLDGLKDQKVEFQVTLSPEDVQAYMVANMSGGQYQPEPEAKTETSPAAETVIPDEDTIKSRMAKLHYDNAQIEQAAFAMTDGLSQDQILQWFRPEIPAAEMDRARQEQLRDLNPSLPARAR